MGNTHSLINHPPVETPDAGAELQGSWEQRWHPLLQEWVIFSAHRQDRPWTGERFASQHTEQNRHDPDCYLCPGNVRINGDVNPEYSGVFVFDNDRPSISFDAPAPLDTPPGIYRNKPATGRTRVLCYSPLHNLTNDTMLAFVPYFARFAYEVFIAPKRTVAHVSALNDCETADLTALMRTELVKMDNLWEMSFLYLIMLHQAPVDSGDYRLFHFHIDLYPPLRTPELRKYVAAHEIGGGNFLADTMSEAKAAELRSSANQQ